MINCVEGYLMAKICKNCGKRLADNIFYCDCGGISFVSGEELKAYNNLRDSIQKLLELIRTVDISSKKDFPLMDYYINNSPESLETTLLSDFFDWTSFLAYSDGHIAKEEVTFINYILNFNYTEKDILNLSGSDREDYIDSLPPSFVFMHEIDLFWDGKHPSIVEKLYDIYHLLGSLFIECDGVVELSEKNAFLSFMGNLKKNIILFQYHSYDDIIRDFTDDPDDDKNELNDDDIEVITNLTERTKENMESVLKLLSKGSSLEEIEREGYPTHKIKAWFRQGRGGDGNYIDFHNKLIDLRPDIATQLGNNQQVFGSSVKAFSEMRNEKELEDILGNLNNLVGLENVKRDVISLINLIRVRKLREKRGLKQPDMSLHLVFSGNPGTGKTTVARMLAECYNKLGLLSKGHLVETDRSGLVAGYVGQTAIQTKEVIEKAMGGILFIDEAYTLSSSKSEVDYGNESINTILKEMEDHRDDFIVILAGYPDLMEEFLSSNPGFESRINKYIHFGDYTPQELYDIFMTMCDDYSYELDDDADEYIRNHFKELYENRNDNFANGRSVRNIFEKVLTNQANRIVDIPNISNEDLNTLIFEDFLD